MAQGTMTTTNAKIATVAVSNVGQIDSRSIVDNGLTENNEILNAQFTNINDVIVLSFRYNGRLIFRFFSMGTLAPTTVTGTLQVLYR